MGVQRKVIDKKYNFWIFQLSQGFKKGKWRVINLSHHLTGQTEYLPLKELVEKI